MDNNEEKNGISLFSQSDEFLADADPLEEFFALNLGDFVSEHLISDDLAKKISKNEHGKKIRLINQLSELVSIYSINNTLCLLNLENKDDYAIYTAIAHSVVQMLEVEKCNIYLTTEYAKGMANPDFNLVLVGSSAETIREGYKYGDNSIVSIAFARSEVCEQDDVIAVPMYCNTQKVGVISVQGKQDKPVAKSYKLLLESMAKLFATSLTLQGSIDETLHIIDDELTSESDLRHARAELTALIADLCDYQQDFVEHLALAVDTKGHYKVSHSKNTAELARKICKGLELNEKTTDLIYYAGLLQNIGKIAVPEKIFSTGRKLSSEELNKIQEHTNIGVHLLMNINFLSEVVPYITYQKERVDGSGTPEGLKGRSIPLGSRIIAVADAYCALTSDRPFREAMDKDKAVSILREEAGKKWDTDVINALSDCIS